MAPASQRCIDFGDSPYAKKIGDALGDRLLPMLYSGGMELLAFFIFFLDRLIDVEVFFVFVSVLLSWFPHFSVQHPRIASFLHDVTEPLYRVVRLVPHRFGMIDLSPLWAIFLLDIVRWVLRYALSSFIA